MRSFLAILTEVLSSPVLVTDDQRRIAMENLVADYDASLTASKPLIKAALKTKEYLQPRLSGSDEEQASEASQSSYLHVHINGFMMANDTMSHYGCRHIANQISLAKQNGANGVLLEVDSGGGQALAGHLINEAVLDCDLPVYALVHNAGSAAFRAIQGADKIFMSNGAAQAGSIGAYTSIDMKMVSAYAERFKDIYARQSTEKNLPIRAFIEDKNDKQLTDEISVLAQVFIDEVKLNRKPDQIVFKGAMYFADDAIKLGLADGYSSKASVISLFNSKSNTMFKNASLQTGYLAMVAMINSIFGTSHTAETEPQAIADSLTAQKPIAEQLSAIRGEMQVQLDAMQAQVDTMSAQLSSTVSANTTLTATVSQLNTDLIASQTALATALAKGAGNAKLDNDLPAASAMERFAQTLDEGTPEGESKY